MNLNDNEINVNQIQEIHYNRLKKRVDVFDKALKQCYRVIRQSVEREDTWCLYTIPEIIFGNPLYKIPDCANYLYRSLRKNGFTVKYIFPNHLVIMWNYKKRDQRMLDYPIQLQNNSVVGSGYDQRGSQQSSVKALPAPPVRIDIIKRGETNKMAGGGSRGNNTGGVSRMNGMNSTKEYKPSGMFLFNKKRS